MATILLTDIDRTAIERLTHVASLHKMTPGQYVERLVDLHEDLREFAKHGSDSREIDDLLRAAGLDY